MADNNFLIVFSKPFLRRLEMISSIEDIKEELKTYSERNNVGYNETVYSYVKTILKNGTYFGRNIHVSQELFFEAAFWSSKLETKQKIRPKNFNDIKDKKNSEFFSKLTQSVILALIEHFYEKDSDLDNIKFKLELSSYIKTLYEVSCIKRDRLHK